MKNITDKVGWRALRFAGEASFGRGWAGSLFVAAAVMTRGDVYVSPTGADSNPGTKSRPFATLEAARDHLRHLRAEHQRASGGFTIWLRGGDYHRDQVLALEAVDSGLPGAPVTWRAFPGERARLLGGRKLPSPVGGSGRGAVGSSRAADWGPVEDAAVRRRLPEGARDQVRQLDLRALGIRDFGEMKSRGFGRPEALAHCELFYGGRPMVLARWPNEGEFARIAGFPDAGGRMDEHGGRLGDLKVGFQYAGERPRGWQTADDLWVHGYWAWDWANSYERVAAIDADHHLVRTAPPYGQYGFRTGQRFYFLNVLEELDQPGEWYLDRRSGVLYFWPPPAAGEAGETLISLLAGPLVELTNASYVTLDGLVLEASRGDAVEIQGGTNDVVAGCLIRNIGDSGVVVRGGLNHRVVSCDVFDTGDGGVSLTGGDRQTLVPGGHSVENCHFARQGRWSKCYVPAIQLQGVGLQARHNLIHDHPHCGILFGGNDHLIEGNELHHVALETGDVGAIYTGRDYTFRGNRIRQNFIHHTGGVGMGSMGVYMDDCVSGTEIAGNVFYKVQRAVFLGGGRDHRVEDNIFVECDPAVQLDGRGLDRSPVWHDMVDKTMRAGLRAMPADLYRTRYPALRDLDRVYGAPGGPAIEGAEFKGVPPEGNVVARNVCVGKWLEVGWGATAENVASAGNFLSGAPGFVGPIDDASRVGAFALKPDSPARASGIHAPPVSRIGLQVDPWRQALEARERGR